MHRMPSTDVVRLDEVYRQVEERLKQDAERSKRLARMIAEKFGDEAARMFVDREVKRLEETYALDV